MCLPIDHEHCPSFYLGSRQSALTQCTSADMQHARVNIPFAAFVMANVLNDGRWDYQLNNRHEGHIKDKDNLNRAVCYSFNLLSTIKISLYGGGGLTRLF